MPQLKVLNDTIFKLRPLQSSVLPDQEECPESSGKIFELDEYSMVNDHIKVTLSAPLAPEFKDQRVWYVYSGHAQVMKGANPVIITDYRLQVLKETVLKLHPVQSGTLPDAEKNSIAAGTFLNLHSYSLQNDHIKVAFANRSFKGRNTWYVYEPHVKVFKNGIPVSFSKALAKEDFITTAAMLGVEVAALKAVVSVESNGSGFLDDGRPKILFEAHIFSYLTGNIYDNSHPEISSKKWNNRLYSSGSGEYKRLEKAKALNAEAALKSASWGLPQIIGENFEVSGYSDVFSFVKDMHESEGKQIKAMANFIKGNGLNKALKDRDWAAFAKGYNGPSYKQNAYDTKLANAYARFSAEASA
jgi:hypothetical protein